MPVICPTVTASSEEDYREQIEKIAHFAHRIHIDLTDGQFAPRQLVKPENAWWPVGIKADFHLMYHDPTAAIKTVIKHKPNLIIVHAEASGIFETFAQICKQHSVKVGIALLQKTSVREILPRLDLIDHALIFSGNLGYQGGGRVDLALLEKVKMLKQKKPDIEIGWDGGINDQSISHLAFAGVEVFDVGSFIQKADDPEKAFNTLLRIADETGTT